MTTRVRFAPSPTGYLHIGSARTALFNYLYARHTGGKFLLRIEDTDIARSTEESTRSILDGLAWLELDHDEDIVFQSNNADKHRATALKLLEADKAYRDFTPKVETTGDVKEGIADRARAAQGVKNMRDNPYRDLSKNESDARSTAGEPFAIRLKVPMEGRTAFDDAVYGMQERNYDDTEDLVLLRSDGHPLYNLAVVCDDIDMQITHVIRGQDHLTNTHKQILIYEALGLTPPTFAHLPLILAPNKGKLSKRKHGEVVSMTTYRDAGFLSLPFVNFLLRLGWSQPQDSAEILLDGQKAEAPLFLSDNEIGELAELVEVFDLDGVKKSPAIFTFVEGDPKHWTDDKAIFFNAEYIRTMPLADLVPFVKPELKTAKLWRDEYEDDDKAWFENTINLIRQRFFTVKDFSSQGRAYFSEDYDFDPAAIEKNLSKFPDLKMWLPELADRFEEAFTEESVSSRIPMRRDKGSTPQPFTEENIETVIKAFTEEKGTKLGVIMNGARTLLTGVAVGPSMLAVFETIGLEKTIIRLRSQLGWQ